MTPLLDTVRAQLPERIRDRLILKLRADPYLLRAEIVVTVNDEPQSCPVEFQWAGRQPTVCLIPDWFISHLLTLPLE